MKYVTNQPFTYSIESKIIIITLIGAKKTAPHSDTAVIGSQEELSVSGRVHQPRRAGAGRRYNKHKRKKYSRKFRR